MKVRGEEAFTAEVVKYFKVSSTGVAWNLRCKRCPAVWTFPLGITLGVGGRLRLLDHARSHPARKAARS